MDADNGIPDTDFGSGGFGRDNCHTWPVEIAGAGARAYYGCDEQEDGTFLATYGECCVGGTNLETAGPEGGPQCIVPHDFDPYPNTFVAEDKDECGCQWFVQGPGCYKANDFNALGFPADGRYFFVYLSPNGCSA